MGSHPKQCTGYVSYSLQFIYHSTTYNTWASTQNNVINNNTKFRGEADVKSVTTSTYICIYINISKI